MTPFIQTQKNLLSMQTNKARTTIIKQFIPLLEDIDIYWGCTRRYTEIAYSLSGINSKTA